MPSPTTASSSPATAGPTTRAALNTAELSEMALIRSSLLVIWITSACRPGMSKALITPSRPASASTCQTCTRPERVSAASAKACNMDRVCVTMTTFWREKRSAAIPPRGPRANTAICAQNQAVPSRSSEWVRRYTSQLCATFCIQVPTSETIWPPMKRRKLRWRRARKVCGTRLGASSAVSGRAGSSPNCGGATPILIFQNNARYNGGSIIRTFQEIKFWRKTNCIRQSTWAAAPSRSASPSERRSRCVNRKSGTRAAARASNLRAPVPSRSVPSHFNSRAMKITELVLHPIAIADPPLRSSYGLHAPFALRTIVELKTDSGLTGFSETYGGDGPLAGLESVRTRVIGMDPFQLAGAVAGSEPRGRARNGERAGRPLADLPGAGREPAGPPRAHLRRHRDRLPGPDRQGHRQAGLRRDRRTRARRSQLLGVPLLQARRRRRRWRRRARRRIRRGAVGRRRACASAGR